ncbi:E3 SUMO-protein ligase NSE2-like [Cimex lectularius]|uniref:E3 SUMO-protein ligase NSE2 n=1 Tax=Cimex lectularius TaxID=79782 RepID=A0A8I6RUC9_CIMLE|nr:E3 SUMO-protein ligase NSE2-like [Cimex lectularius]
MLGSDIGKLFKEQHQRTMELAESIIENVKDSSRDELIEMLREVVSENEANMNNQAATWKAYEAVKKIMKESVDPIINAQEIFDEEVKNIPAEIRTDFVKSFDDLTTEKLDMSLQMNCSNVSSQPMLDPWTKQPIKNPVKSTICAHTYDKDSIICQIKTNKKFRCPYIGCNAVLTKKKITEV